MGLESELKAFWASYVPLLELVEGQSGSMPDELVTRANELFTKLSHPQAWRIEKTKYRPPEEWLPSTVELGGRQYSTEFTERWFDQYLVGKVHIPVTGSTEELVFTPQYKFVGKKQVRFDGDKHCGGCIQPPPDPFGIIFGETQERAKPPHPPNSSLIFAPNLQLNSQGDPKYVHDVQVRTTCYGTSVIIPEERNGFFQAISGKGRKIEIVLESTKTDKFASVRLLNEETARIAAIRFAFCSVGQGHIENYLRHMDIHY